MPRVRILTAERERPNLANVQSAPRPKGASTNGYRMKGDADVMLTFSTVQFLRNETVEPICLHSVDRKQLLKALCLHSIQYGL